MTWRVAGSLDQLLSQLGQLAPGRSRVSDGSIGDLAHLARRSDHNPRAFPWADQPLVLARDFTHDPAGGLDCGRLAAALREGRDRRVRYVIWDRQIMSGSGGPAPWAWRPYSGTNPHDHHLHLSVVADARAELRIPWLLPGLQSGRPTIRRGGRGTLVGIVQRFLGVHPVDEIFGPATERAVCAYQAMRGIEVDGIVGPATWREMQI